MSFHKHVLPNGLTIVGEISPSARSVAVGFFIKTGARDETPAESGVSHFLEHMVFKGTPHRSALEVNLDFDKIGADYNAGTSEETTSFYALVLPEYLAQAVEILADILRPSLRSEDFEMEKKVIIEEIGMYDDSPGWCAYDNARKAYFADHPLGNSVLGTKESITALSRDQMQAYFDRRYVASNITVAVAGNFHWDDAVEVIDKHCGLWPTGTASRPIVKPAEPRRLLKVITKEKLNQEQAYLLAPAPAADSIQRYAADALAMIIGDSSGSRLYWALIDPGLAESADMNFQENTQDILALIQEILREVQNEGVSDEELAVAKSKILSRVVRSSERPKGRMQALGIGWTYLRTYRSVDEELQNFDAVSLKDIRNVLDQYPFDQLTVLALGPLAKLE
jgi:predicted Zn-dependent peptidase